jgi:hypothetical protein
MQKNSQRASLWPNTQLKRQKLIWIQAQRSQNSHSRPSVRSTCNPGRWAYRCGSWVLDLLGGTTLEHMTFTNGGPFLHRRTFYKSKPNQFLSCAFFMYWRYHCFLLFLVFTKTKHRFLKKQNRTWLIHQIPKCIELSGIEAVRQFRPGTELQPATCDATFRCFKQDDAVIYGPRSKNCWRHFLETDFAVSDLLLNIWYSYSSIIWKIAANHTSFFPAHATQYFFARAPDDGACKRGIN